MYLCVFPYLFLTKICVFFPPRFRVSSLFAGYDTSVVVSVAVGMIAGVVAVAVAVFYAFVAATAICGAVLCATVVAFGCRVPRRHFWC